MRGEYNDCYVLAFSPNGKFLASGGRNLIIWGILHIGPKVVYTFCIFAKSRFFSVCNFFIRISMLQRLKKIWKNFISAKV